MEPKACCTNFPKALCANPCAIGKKAKTNYVLDPIDKKRSSKKVCIVTEGPMMGS